MAIIFGQMKSFAGLDFTSTSSPTYPVKTCWPLSMDCEYDVALLGVGKVYPFDAQGLEAAPFKGTPTITYELILLATAGLSEALAYKDLRNRWNMIYSMLQGTYTWGSITGVSGQKGTLTVADEDPAVSTTYSCTARVLKPAPFELTKGQPTELVVQLPFVLLSDFA